jgi:prophage antirepressor-like protein
MKETKNVKYSSFLLERSDSQGGLEGWWVANNVCRVIGQLNLREPLSKLEEDQKGVIQNDTPGGSQTPSRGIMHARSVTGRRYVRRTARL